VLALGVRGSSLAYGVVSVPKSHINTVPMVLGAGIGLDPIPQPYVLLVLVCFSAGLALNLAVRPRVPISRLAQTACFL
jgi:hydrogenase/urease accessory protein HupE